MARRVTYGAACSLDGFIARPDGAVDWLHFSRDVEEIMTRYWRGVDAVLMGRKTWEVAAGSGAGAPAGKDMKAYVFSKTLSPASVQGAELVSTDAGAFVRRLKEMEGGDICLLGGGQLASALIAAGVVDEVGLNLHPVLLGDGIPLFADPGRQTNLELVSSRELDGGCVMLTYRVQSG